MPEQDLEVRLMAKLARGEAIRSQDEMTHDYRQALIRLMLMQADSELAAAFGYVPWITQAVSTKEMLRISSIVHDEVRHARVMFKLLEDFGIDADTRVKEFDYTLRIGETFDLGTNRATADLRMNVFYYPIMSWYDFIIFSVLTHRAAWHQLFDTSLCSYGPWCEVIEGILKEEEMHMAHADYLLKRHMHGSKNRFAAQESLDLWFKRVLNVFGTTDSEHNKVYKKYGLKKRDNFEVRGAYVADLAKVVASVGLKLPAWNAFSYAKNPSDATA
jgi:ring-1,2-phenylacetyl-CoA epoxidase subunit PaaA